MWNHAILAILALGTVPTQPSAQEASYYEIDFLAGNLLRPKIHAVVPVPEGRLEMGSYGAWSQPEGWATFVEELSAQDEAGRSLELEKSGRLTWRIVGPHEGRVELSYVVDLSHAAAGHWPDGPRTTACFSDGEAISILATAVFLRPFGAHGAEVQVLVPDGWDVAAPWDRASDDGFVFREASLEEMVDDLFVVGRFERRVVREGPLEVQIVPLGDRRGAADLLAGATARILRYYVDLMEHEEPISLLQVWFRDGDWETGEAYRRSYAAVWPEVPGPENVIVWSDSIAHELFHLWNGHAIAAQDESASQWFMEGMTEYVANLAAVRSGVIDSSGFARLMERHLLMYWMFVFNGPWERLSLVEAGTRKSDYNAAIYDGGWLAAFCLDVRIREESDGERSVDDLMRLLHERFGRTGTLYTNEDLFEAASEIANAELSSFFASFVAGRTPLPYREFLERAGCDATVSGHLVIVRGPTDADAIFAKILAGE